MKGEGGTKEGRKGSFEMRVTNSPLHLYHLPQMMKKTMMKTTVQVDTRLQKQIANSLHLAAAATSMHTYALVVGWCQGLV